MLPYMVLTVRQQLDCGLKPGQVVIKTSWAKYYEFLPHQSVGFSLADAAVRLMHAQ